MARPQRRGSLECRILTNQHHSAIVVPCADVAGLRKILDIVAQQIRIDGARALGAVNYVCKFRVPWNEGDPSVIDPIEDTRGEGFVPLRVDEYRDRRLAIRRGDVPWEEVERWRLALHREVDVALASTPLPEHPDYERANSFLIRARRMAASQEYGQ